MESKGKILVAHGDTALLEALVGQVHHLDYAVMQPDKAGTVMTCLELDNVDIVICDVRLLQAQTGGSTLIERIRAHHRASVRETPVIGISGGVDAETQTWLQEHGPTHLIVTPVSTAELGAIIAKMVRG